MNKREMLENKLTQNSLLSGLLKEESDNIQLQLAEIDKPKLRHGDYGYDKHTSYAGQEDEAFPEPFFINADREYSYPLNEYNRNNKNRKPVVLGNIFDDLKRNSEDLTEFDICNQGGNDLRIKHVKEVGRYKDGIEFSIHKHTSTANIDQAIKIHQKLGQIISTAKRRNN